MLNRGLENINEGCMHACTVFLVKFVVGVLIILTCSSELSCTLQLNLILSKDFYSKSASGSHVMTYSMSDHGSQLRWNG